METRQKKEKSKVGICIMADNNYNDFSKLGYDVNKWKGIQPGEFVTHDKSWPSGEEFFREEDSLMTDDFKRQLAWFNNQDYTIVGYEKDRLVIECL